MILSIVLNVYCVVKMREKAWKRNRVIQPDWNTMSWKTKRLWVLNFKGHFYASCLNIVCQQFCPLSACSTDLRKKKVGLWLWQIYIGVFIFWWCCQFSCSVFLSFSLKTFEVTRMVCSDYLLKHLSPVKEISVFLF